eukprot:NODE_249_length_12946_cov_0.357438.p12 type:complete len:117 gc:universal NODE_249_length_12946_cov_0.357438:10232-10582(+)
MLKKSSNPLNIACCSSLLFSICIVSRINSNIDPIIINAKIIEIILALLLYSKSSNVPNTIFRNFLIFESSGFTVYISFQPAFAASCSSNSISSVPCSLLVLSRFPAIRNASVAFIS